ncbi:Transcriptional regulator GlxA family, contains an amidase domain and an AraC-type DNA-binding HTH domain [Nocardiopsis flavescens]|uniref:Transcriptional regulator GlxA family, contains an amidase domain and an AraC-type DNA-binding HTH domain n=1 Tax=Nocardiopsis flavescens TaxID=758803 RepID=A0A1M6AIS8_9ACTN|nr:GlxA family transcriptional regulator [Nocardiopsis flavescens]SHI36390.1 Transcriptional regulator GlxA family, contains an amidase domain and an AraC-type DNA-binding HTH domain [Nocardiopsis flavescens]
MEHEVVIVVFDGVQSLDVSGPLEVFAGAARAPGGRYRVRVASLGGGAVASSSGLGLVPSVALEEVGRIDTLVVAGGEGARGEADPALVAWLAGACGRAGRVASVCTGAFLLARAGVLEGLRVTTHWAYCEELARRFPGVEVVADPIFVRQGRVVTSAGVSAGVDLSLALVEEDLGRRVALAVARHLVVFLRRPGGQAQFSAPLAQQWAQRPAVREVQHWIVEHPGADLSVQALAGRVGLSVRQFARVFARQVGCTPGRYVERVRVEAARRWLEESEAGVEAVARRCGFGSAEVMRRVFVRSLGCSPAGYRSRFHGGGV